MDTQQPGIQLQTFPPQGSRRVSQDYSVTLNGSFTSPSRQKTREEGPQEDSGGPSTSPEELPLPTLPPVDGGIKAWSFVAAAFVLETLVWGFGFT